MIKYITVKQYGQVRDYVFYSGTHDEFLRSLEGKPTKLETGLIVEGKKIPEEKTVLYRELNKARELESRLMYSIKGYAGIVGD